MRNFSSPSNFSNSSIITTTPTAMAYPKDNFSQYLQAFIIGATVPYIIVAGITATILFCSALQGKLNPLEWCKSVLRTSLWFVALAALTVGVSAGFIFRYKNSSPDQRHPWEQIHGDLIGSASFCIALVGLCMITIMGQIGLKSAIKHFTNPERQRLLGGMFPCLVPLSGIPQAADTDQHAQDRESVAVVVSSADSDRGTAAFTPR